MPEENVKGYSAILADGRINISRLEHEINAELTDDARNAAVESMKKRAIHISKDYDEFEKFVAVSQLKPVRGSEMKQLFSGAVNTSASGSYPTIHRSANKVYQKKNHRSDFVHISSNSIGNATGTDVSNSSALIGLDLTSKKASSTCTTKKKKKNTKKSKSYVIRNGLELSSQWKKWCTSPQSALKFLLLPIGARLEEDMEIIAEINLGTSNLILHEFQTNEKSELDPSVRLQPEDVIRLCKVEMEADIMEGIMGALNLAVSIDRANEDTDTSALSNFIYRWILSISKCGRFCLNVDFLNIEQKDWVLRIMGFLEEQIDVSSEVDEDGDDRTKCFIYNRKDLELLRVAYNIVSIPTCGRN